MTEKFTRQEKRDLKRMDAELGPDTVTPVGPVRRMARAVLRLLDKSGERAQKDFDAEARHPNRYHGTTYENIQPDDHGSDTAS